MIELAPIAGGSQSQNPGPLLRGASKKVWISNLLMGVWVLGETCLFLKVFQIILHDLEAWSGGVSTTTNQFLKHSPGIPHQLTSEMKSMQLMQLPQVEGSILSSL